METKINFLGKERKFRIGIWAIGEIQAMQSTTENLIANFAYILYFGIIQGSELREAYSGGEDLEFDLFDCYDWIDEQEGGVSSIEVKRIMKIFEESTKIHGFFSDGKNVKKSDSSKKK